ncbi:glycosyltransferase family 4 protein [Neomoorella thermoacetica]|uniref:glycosyltransferase family 4 protein n=1 Tax=Neomoorella thermoacetica TaxID=1525 RepID=UPI0008FBAFE0|nr:glycosyltransferase family 4 protein [Moorella thermoacetica]OIQ60436.1 GDP-mannose-dependent alpha-(1-6)-phosphatidylinositol monomannoside mannosyltransferase [Moorella thermoacetica]
MKVAFYQFFPPTLWTPGGGETQLVKTKEALERLGVEVTLFNPWSRSKDFDILHVFGSSHELSSFVRAAKGLGLPVVVSIIAFSAKPSWQWWLWRRIDRFIPIPTTYRLRQEIYTNADRLIVASRSEAEQLSHGFRINNKKYRWVPHGIEGERFIKAEPKLFIERYGLQDFVLQVSRINRHKGQARLIRALEGTGIKLVFIGPLDPIDQQGTQEFLNLVEKHSGWVHYLGTLKYDDQLLPSAYAACRVHVLPSTSESLGLVTLESTAAGAAAVSGNYPTLYEYLGERVYYCEPASIASIRASVLQAYEEGIKPGAREYVVDNFSWDRTAERLLEVYQEVLA